jgi:hypothetical protein
VTDFKVGKIDVDLGIGYGLTPPTKRCIQRIAELALTANCSAASCRDAPASIDATTRSRQALSLWESLRFTQTETCSSRSAHARRPAPKYRERERRRIAAATDRRSIGSLGSGA